MKSELSLAEAEKLAQGFLDKTANPHEIVIVPGKSKKFDFGYVVQCMPKKQLETGSWQKYGVPGVESLIIDKLSHVV